jgi:hypothetical protein
MMDRTNSQGRRPGRAARRLGAAAAAAVLGLALSPAAAHASVTLSGSAQASGINLGTAQANAEAAAKVSLLTVAYHAGVPTCINITYVDSLVYVIPGGGGDVYNSTATGLCGNLVFQYGATLTSATTQAWGPNLGGAQSAAESAAYADLMSKANARGYTVCTNVTYSDTLVYVVPSGGGDVYNSTATGQCGTQVLQ